MPPQTGFRPRTVDEHRPMPIWHGTPPDFDDSFVSRSVPAMPSGMDEEEEREQHLVAIVGGPHATAMSHAQNTNHSSNSSSRGSSRTTGRSSSTSSSSQYSGGIGLTPSSRQVEEQQRPAIPIPTIVRTLDYEERHAPDWRRPGGDEAGESSLFPSEESTYVTFDELSYNDPDTRVEYDADAADEAWLDARSPNTACSIDTFELVIDRLEKAAYVRRNTLTEREALAELLPFKVRPAVGKEIYAYWVDKVRQWKRPLLDRHVEAPSWENQDPLVPFRPRDRPKPGRVCNDILSLEVMLQMRRDYELMRTITSQIIEQEKKKFELLELESAQVLDSVPMCGATRKVKALWSEMVDRVQACGSGVTRPSQLERRTKATGTHPPLMTFKPEHYLQRDGYLDLEEDEADVGSSRSAPEGGTTVGRPTKRARPTVSYADDDESSDDLSRVRRMPTLLDSLCTAAATSTIATVPAGPSFSYDALSLMEDDVSRRVLHDPTVPMTATMRQLGLSSISRAVADVLAGGDDSASYDDEVDDDDDDDDDTRAILRELQELLSLDPAGTEAMIKSVLRGDDQFSVRRLPNGNAELDPLNNSRPAPAAPCNLRACARISRGGMLAFDLVSGA